MTRKTTSIHHLNADRGLNTLQKALCFSLNWINNLFPYAHVDRDLTIRSFVCEDLDTHWPQLHIKSSPGRRLSDLFWMTLPWQAIKAELGAIHVLDTGCGSGNYGLRLADWSHDLLASYTGIDVYAQDNWAELERQHANFRLLQRNVYDFLQSIPDGTNFLMSQSAVEHFDQDLLYFEQIKDYVCTCKNSVIQVHLFPARACLALYGLHGVRQYTPRTVSQISRLFKGFSYTVLFGLGGQACNRLHYKFVTKPMRRGIGDLRDLRPQEYDRRSLTAVVQDMQCPPKSPTFYALVIHSNWQKKIFL